MKRKRECSQDESVSSLSEYENDYTSEGSETEAICFFIPNTLTIYCKNVKFIPPEDCEHVLHKPNQIIKGVICSQYKQNKNQFDVYLKTSVDNENHNTWSASTLMRTPYINSHGKAVSLIGDYDLLQYIDKFKETLNSKILESELINLIIDIGTQIMILDTNKFIHNDIKPSNIIYLQNHWYLIDYEFSIDYESIIENLCIDKENNRIINKCGTRTYFPPEKKTSKLISPSGDIYSFGLTLLYCLSNGTINFDNINEASIDNILRESNINQNLQLLIKSMLEIDYKKRIGTDELISKLKLIDKKLTGLTLNFFLDTTFFKRKIAFALSQNAKPITNINYWKIPLKPDYEWEMKNLSYFPNSKNRHLVLKNLKKITRIQINDKF